MTDADPPEPADSTGSDDLGEIPTDPAEARRLVKARLVPEDRVDEDLVHRRALPGVEAVLVFDLPDRLVPVATGDLARLLTAGSATRPEPSEGAGTGPGDDAPDAEQQLWDEAFDRVAVEDLPEIDVQEFAEGVPVMLLHSTSLFCATNALWVERFVDAPPEGMIFAVPNRHVVLIHVIRDQSVAVALPNLVLLARENYAQGEGPVSPDVFWWHDSQVERIGVTESMISPSALAGADHGTTDGAAGGVGGPAGAPAPDEPQLHLQIDLPEGLAEILGAWAPPE